MQTSVDLADGSEDGISVQGRPLHKSKEELIDAYVESKDEFLREEAARSVGKYVLVDNRTTDPKFVSSPMFSGGYVDLRSSGRLSTSLGSIIEERDGEVEINTAKLYHHLKGTGNPLPYSTVFKDVIRFPAGCVLESTDGGYKLREYVSEATASSDPPEIKNLLRQVIDRIEANNDDITVLFSGGVDSGLIYATLAECFDHSPRLVTFDWPGPSNNPTQAETLASALGEEVEVIGYKHGLEGEREEVLSLKEDVMERDLRLINTPYFALTPDVIDEDEVLLSGQNLGEISGLHMMQQQFKLRYRLANAGEFDGIWNTIYDEIKRLILNTQYTDSYLQNEYVRKAIIGIIDLKLSDRVADSSELGTMGGFLSSMVPSFYESPQRVDTKEELSILDNASVSGEFFDTFYFHSVMADSNNAVSPTKFGNSGHMFLPGSAGPSLSHMFSKERGLSEAYFPKRDYYEAFEDLTGVNYHGVDWDLSFATDTTARLRGGGQSALLNRNEEYVSSPIAPNYFDSNQFVSAIEDMYDTTEQRIGAEISDYRELRSAYRVLNLEILLQENL